MFLSALLATHSPPAGATGPAGSRVAEWRGGQRTDRCGAQTEPVSRPTAVGKARCALHRKPGRQCPKLQLAMPCRWRFAKEDLQELGETHERASIRSTAPTQSCAGSSRSHVTVSDADCPTANGRSGEVNSNST